MIPKEKAIELVDKFEPYVIRYTQDDVVGYLDQETPILEYQKQCALILVEEIIDNSPWILDIQQYWKKVKQEIEDI